ncbi:hypothetical protein jhhlp_003115 [Lomentospora prolificans]|uniref:Dynactin subunit 6 n=1 Tax=Lomentospora prolificans TaxID=41688 RepID=A0A2N3NFY9_9PEZI|nr:hypothetical protein jhhlp_003115 [Lomentospora prolificans]
MSSNKRNSMLPPVAQHGPKPPVKLSSTLTIADSAILTGIHSIVIMSESVVHPRCRLESMVGSLLVGKRCIIHERTHIGACPATGDGMGGGVTVGDYATIEATSVIEAGGTDIGEGTVVGVGARVCAGARIGKNCTISPKTIIAPGEEIPDFTVVLPGGVKRLDRREMGDMRHRAQVRQIEVLRRLIPTNLAKFQ